MGNFALPTPLSLAASKSRLPPRPVSRILALLSAELACKPTLVSQETQTSFLKHAPRVKIDFASSPAPSLSSSSFSFLSSRDSSSKTQSSEESMPSCAATGGIASEGPAAATLDRLLQDIWPPHQESCGTGSVELRASFSPLHFSLSFHHRPRELCAVMKGRRRLHVYREQLVQVKTRGGGGPCDVWLTLHHLRSAIAMGDRWSKRRGLYK